MSSVCDDCKKQKYCLGYDILSRAKYDIRLAFAKDAPTIEVTVCVDKD